MKSEFLILTGNLCYSALVVDEIKSHIGFLAPIDIFPGEDELENLALSGLEFLRSKDLSVIQNY